MYNMVAKSSAVTMLSVSKPSGQADTQATGLVAFGKDPNSSTEQGHGVGIYSTPFCIKAGATLANGEYGANYQSNCGMATAQTYGAAVANADNTKVLDLVNSLEVTWALPYDIPNDRTQADIICKTEQASGGSDAATHWEKDPLRIHQSSMIAKGWGTGNCFYLGVNGDFQTPGQHRFQCRDIGALKSGASLQLAFQYSISNEGKAMILGPENVATNNIVNIVAKTLQCELKINTYSAAKTSGTNWYQATFTTKVDGDSIATTSFGKFSSYVATQQGFASIGQKVAEDATNYQQSLQD